MWLNTDQKITPNVAEEGSSPAEVINLIARLGAEKHPTPFPGKIPRNPDSAPRSNRGG